MSKKQPNRLAELIDHQAFAGSALPQTLADNISLYTKATEEVKKLLVDCLPEEILHSCWVVGLTPEQLILSVASTTAANHIRYLKNAYLQVLTEQSITFQQLKQIQVVVSNIELKTDVNNSLSKRHSTANNSELKRHEANENQALSQNIKRTITQAAEHVTTDKNLKKALLRLAGE